MSLFVLGPGSSLQSILSDHFDFKHLLPTLICPTAAIKVIKSYLLMFGLMYIKKHLLALVQSIGYCWIRCLHVWQKAKDLKEATWLILKCSVYKKT